MTLHVPRLPFSLDPLMAEAKQRARQRRVIFSAAGVVALALALALFLALGGGGRSGAGSRPRAARPSGAGSSPNAGRVGAVTIRPAYFVNPGGLTKPPGGADLRKKHRLLLQHTAVGPVAIWVAPDWAVRGNCAWLTIRGAVRGGECRRTEPPRRGLSGVVPFRLPLTKGRHALPLLWGNVGRDVASLEVHFQDGTMIRLSLTDGIFFRVFPTQRWLVGHRPSLLIARYKDGFAFRKRLIIKSSYLRLKPALAFTRTTH